MTPTTLLLLSSLLSLASAGPVVPHAVIEGRQLEGGNVRAPIWIPIVVIVGFLSLVVLIAWVNKARLRNAFGGRTRDPAQAANSGPRELTADQLAGTINGTTATGAPPRTRRARRPRRTPSQMSVTSLPAYNKEPGEQELVVTRGADPEDMPVARIAEEDDGDSSEESGNRRNNTRYDEMPDSPPNMPLMTEYTSPVNDIPSQPTAIPSATQETTALLRIDDGQPNTATSSPTEAPPFYEVVDPAPIAQLTSPVSPAPASPPPSNADPPPPSSPERQSGLRTFFHRMSTAGAPRSVVHARGPSDASHLSSDTTHPYPSSASPTGNSVYPSRHRTTPSSASSFFRTLSRQSVHSQQNSIHLNSPSLISLNSIGPPLTHTLLRTEFTYPKTGPTPEQLAIISSRESIGRFAVPYGEDAVAFASTSRLDISSPPPGFDTILAGVPPTVNANASASSMSLHRRGESQSSGASFQALLPSPLAQVSSSPEPPVPSGTVSQTLADEPLKEPSSSGPIISAPAISSELSNNTIRAQKHDQSTVTDQAAERSIAAKYHVLPFANDGTVRSTAPSTTVGPVSEFGALSPGGGSGDVGGGTHTSTTSSSSPSIHGRGTAYTNNYNDSSAQLSVSDADSYYNMRSESRASQFSTQTFQTAQESQSVISRRQLASQNQQQQREGADSRMDRRMSAYSDAQEYEYRTDSDETDSLEPAPSPSPSGGSEFGVMERRVGTPTAASFRSTHGRVRQEATDDTVTQAQTSASVGSKRDTIIAPRLSAATIVKSASVSSSSKV